MKNFLNMTRFERVSNAVAAGTTTVNSSAVNRADFEDVAFAVAFGTITSTAVTSIKAQQSVDGSTWEDVAGSSITVPDTASNKVFLLEIIKPLKLHYRAVVSRGTANAVIDSILAILTIPRTEPVAQPSSIGGTKVLASPISGTA